VSKSSRRAEAARNQVAPAADDFVHSAADRLGPLVHTAADRVGPLAQSAATRVGPLAEAAADRIGAAADKVSPLAHSAAERMGPLAQSAAERVGPMTHQAAERLAPLAHSAADRIAPLANQAAERVSPYAQQAASKVSPYAQQAASKVSPYAHQAAERIAPMATSAKQRGAQVAHDAVEKIAPVVDQTLERVSPAVEAARGKVSSEIVPKISEALSAAAGAPVVVEAKKRGKAAVAAAKGELELPTEKKRRGGWIKWVAMGAVLAGAAVVLVRKFLSGRDADWQAARPTTPYAPPKTADTAAAAPVVNGMEEAGEDPQGGLSAHLLNLQADGSAVPDQPAEGGEYEPADEPTDTTLSAEAAEPGATDEAMAERGPGSDEDAGPSPEAAAAPEAGTPRYQGEGVYVGSEPPEGFTIKGNERSMKYHVPESAGYGRTVAEVWFNSEEAAQQAGFVRAQR
jgi:hypothetical protein